MEKVVWYLWAVSLGLIIPNIFWSIKFWPIRLLLVTCLLKSCTNPAGCWCSKIKMDMLWDIRQISQWHWLQSSRYCGLLFPTSFLWLHALHGKWQNITTDHPISDMHDRGVLSGVTWFTFSASLMEQPYCLTRTSTRSEWPLRDARATGVKPSCSRKK